MSNMYRCEQWGYRGKVRTECFYYNGESAKDVYEDLNLFCWPEKGKWEITNINDEEEDCYPAKQEYDYCEYSY